MQESTTIASQGYNIEFSSLLESSFKDLIEDYSNQKILILVDENTQEHCLSDLLANFDGLGHAEVLTVPAGEESKSIEIAAALWNVLTEYHVTRHDLLINLGGGMITDLGGFVAACYKRGIAFVNIPTSLLAMVDASVGGKTGVNLGHYKNQVGSFQRPVVVYIDDSFLSTLPDREVLSGYGEMLKHALIRSNAEHFEQLLESRKNGSLTLKMIQTSVGIKNDVVTNDPREKGERKILNYGHTIGHAIEGFMFEREVLSHGHAIAIGMLLESFVSFTHGTLSGEEFGRIEKGIQSMYEMPSITKNDFDALLELMRNDKKNKGSAILMCKLDKIGDCSFDFEVPDEVIKEALSHYFKS